jgi:hypothetical protein
MRDVWMRHVFRLGGQFCRYVPPGTTQSRKRVTITFLEVARPEADPELQSDSFVFDFIVSGERLQFPQTGKSNLAVGSILGLGGLTTTFDYFCGVQPINFEVRDGAGNVIRDSAELQPGFAGGTYEAKIKRGWLPDWEDNPSAMRNRTLFTFKYRLNVIEIPVNTRRPVRTVTQ